MRRAESVPNPLIGWLADEVVRWRTELGGAEKERRDATRQLQRAQADPDLEGVRNDEAVGRLPASEAEAWRALWREIRELAASGEDKR